MVQPQDRATIAASERPQRSFGVQYRLSTFE